MRPIALVALFLAACSGGGATAPDLSAQLAALEQRLANLESRQLPADAEVVKLRGDLDALAKQVAAVQAPRVPHLVVKATGEDVGVWLGQTVWIEAAGGEVDPTRTASLEYDGPNCTGTAYLSDNEFAGRRASHLVIDPDGRLLAPDRSMAKAMTRQSADILSRDGTRICLDTPYAISAVPFTALSHRFTARPFDDFAIELR